MKILIIPFVALSLIAMAQNPSKDPIAEKYGNQIIQADLKAYLNVIAADSLEGRETGTRGQKIAADYIRAHFTKLGLKAPVRGNFFQPFELYYVAPGETYVKKGSKTFSNFKDIIYTGRDNSSLSDIPLIFVGQGREQDFNHVDNVKNKAVLIWVKDGRMYNLPEAERARMHGAKAVLVWNTSSLLEFEALSKQTSAYFKTNRPVLEKPVIEISTNPGNFILSPKTVSELIGVKVEKLVEIALDTIHNSALKEIKPVNISLKNSLEVKVITSENVLGYLEGTDKLNELVVITAHYDHIGINEGGNGDIINNGADDDGSGTVTVMELAKVFSEAKKEGHGPRRSILFMTVSGEEKGLLGSDYYTRNPVFPLENTVVDLNIDMIGRRDPQHKDSADYVYVIGADKLSKTLHNVSEQMNNDYTKLVFDYTYNDESHPTRLYYRSDHWNFAKNNIPIIFYFDGIHEDYHKPSDEINKIEFDLLARRAKCVFYTAWEIANRNDRIVPDKLRKDN